MAVKKNKERIIDSLIFLFPTRLVRTHHFSKKDVRNIKDNLTKSFSFVNLIIAIVLFLIIFTLFIFMQVSTNGHYAETYGVAGFVAPIVLQVGCLSTIILIILSRIVKSDKASKVLIRIGEDLLFASGAIYMLLCTFADAQMGFTKESETLSASIIFVTVLILIQPMHWTDAIIADFTTSAGIITVTILGASLYKMSAVHYYILIAVLFPFTGYLFYSLLFYAESQRYTQELENERLHNRAYYDYLTRCKNRHALNEFITENKTRWETRDNINLLIVIFDIDDFKKYNDQFSHLGGDYCLRSICDAIRHEFPSPSLDFFRYGGEEFLLFFELRNPEDAPKLLNSVKNSVSILEIEAPQGAPKRMVTISVGGLLLRSISKFDFDEEMKAVDSYLYKAKSSGKDVVCFNGEIIN